MTSKDYLSQEEIDALLRQSESINSSEPAEKTVDDFLTELEQDALGEIGNITFGSAATALSTLLGLKVDITTPKVSIISRTQFEEAFPKPHVAVHVNYVDGFEGINSLVIKKRDAQVIADLMLGGEGNPVDEELNEIHISAVQEAMNQMMGSSATSMSTIFNRFVNISPPGIDILNLESGEGVSNLPADETLIQVSFRLLIGDLIDSNLMQLLPVHFAKSMVDMLIGGAQESTASAPVASTPEPAPAAVPATPPPVAEQPPVQHQQAPQAPQQPAQDYNGYGQAPMGMPQGMPPQQPYGMPPQQPYGAPQHYGGMPNRNVNVQPVQFANLQNGAYGQVDENNLNLLMDIPLKVTVELGRTQKQIKDILELSQGSIVELDKLAGEPVDILVNNKLIAKGEVVVIDENFGVRVIDIVSQWDRIQKLQ
ncbi:flagellar motor switch phosphatase FliY [Paenibacillus sp. FSL H7-0942]|uniref:Flagellar motor switch phosphatase FliY n=1 Tax=Paenibacillus amylolyticus TaxID=1451 RepID=A0ABD8AYW2_PAEAM|nr:MULTISPECIES: flagellar motor switch phosphatase FliY [Paenibacillus]APO45198.1 flagellar motor switch phosphatase FliY [Paenibacillus xylanexedens]ETT37106.1 flagellar motor switch protein fliN [Paenibacillus sp. FSL R5-192]ETT52290.1 flagellar motor switch protein fliN [Paenibacillus sp. FSL H7-689]KLU53998.1 flagellar motor switch protein FliN [Paenibacillus sp. VT-400]MCF7755187.1 flagellar motor switch phosphatase FliY [Paenibacillus xylanexedens]